MKNTFDDYISRLNTGEQKITELEDMTTQTSKTKEETLLQAHSMKLALLWYQSQTKPQQENYRPIFLMSINIKILNNKILANQIWQHIKRVIYHDQMRFIPRLQGWVNVWKSVNVTYHINRIKDKYYIFSSTDGENAYDQIENPFTSKIFNTLGTEGNNLNILKAIYETNIIHSSERLKDFALRSETRQGFPLLPLPFIIVFKS